MKTYKKTHKLKTALDNHVKKIKQNGGQTKVVGLTVEYWYEKTNIDKNYTHFAILKSNEKILSGWDYKKYDESELKAEKKHYFFDDMEDIFDNLDIKGKDVIIMNKKQLALKKINPFDQKNWHYSK